LTICHAILDFACAINIPSSSEASAAGPFYTTRSGHGNCEPEQVQGVILPANEDAALTLDPCTEAFDDPMPHVAG
jgi:hypothetical protein